MSIATASNAKIQNPVRTLCLQSLSSFYSETDGRDLPFPGTLEQKLSIVGALLSIVKALVLINLCCKHPLERCFDSMDNQLPQLPLLPRPEGGTLACDVLQRCSFYQEEGLSQEIRK
jgi:hypothetical protein